MIYGEDVGCGIRDVERQPVLRFSIEQPDQLPTCEPSHLGWACVIDCK